ncbi:proline reductase cluster protein PrdD [Listeria ilorinensis]|uniref:proline reductase cluster protein PrdD n=1 Tax=Listeria ilorinensis TaxID=2867439 RepID=UPI001EF7345B|nr:proline reductase cluster protein PrdD [Listeria ilorinensis]
MLTIKSFHMQSVETGKKAAIEQGKLIFPLEPKTDYLLPETFEKISVQVIPPNARHVEIHSIMDIVPISTKVLGDCGNGVTHTLTGVYVLVTGGDQMGRQMHEFGSSEGYLDEKVIFGRAGTPGENDFIIHIDILLKGAPVFTRSLAFSMFQASDAFIQPIRDILKMINGKTATERHDFPDPTRKPNGKERIALVKLVAGQGAMYDNLLFPSEPSGAEDGFSNIDLANMPVVLSPNEYRDGALRSLT